MRTHQIVGVYAVPGGVVGGRILGATRVVGGSDRRTVVVDPAEVDLPVGGCVGDDPRGGRQRLPRVFGVETLCVGIQNGRPERGKPRPHPLCVECGEGFRATRNPRYGRGVDEHGTCTAGPGRIGDGVDGDRGQGGPQSVVADHSLDGGRADQRPEPGSDRQPRRIVERLLGDQWPRRARGVRVEVGPQDDESYALAGEGRRESG